MKIVAISGVRNEADIIEPFVRHTLAYCDTLIVLDHGSTDATFEILKKLQQEGLSLHLLQDGTLGHMQVVFMNRLLQLAVADFARTGFSRWMRMNSFRAGPMHLFFRSQSKG